MIYTLTLNPSLDYIVSVEEFKLGLTNRTSEEALVPGGKGVNISIVLGNLGISSIALGFVAGFTGKEIMRRLETAGVLTDFIETQNGFSRINVKLKSVDGTEINGCGPEIREEEAAALMHRLEGLEKGDVLFLAGSIPGSMQSDCYQKIMQTLQGKGIKVVVDATKDLLLKVLPYHPFLIKPNHHELGEIFGVTLHTRQDVIPYGRRLQELGAENVLISMAGEGAVLFTANGEILEAAAPKGELISSVGAGDSMVAGFMAGWMEREDYQHAFRMGIAAGSASAFSEGLAKKDAIEDLYYQVHILEK